MVRLGVLLDDSTAHDTVIRLAVLAQRAGLHGLWLAGGPGQPVTTDLPGLSATLAAAAQRTSTITLGVYLSRLPAPDAVPIALASRFEVVTPARAVGPWPGR